jgi:hypothetical protein
MSSQYPYAVKGGTSAIPRASRNKEVKEVDKTYSHILRCYGGLSGPLHCSVPISVQF